MTYTQTDVNKLVKTLDELIHYVEDLNFQLEKAEKTNEVLRAINREMYAKTQQEPMTLH